MTMLLVRVWMGGMGDLKPPEAVGGSVCSKSSLTWSLPTVGDELHPERFNLPCKCSDVKQASPLLRDNA